MTTQTPKEFATEVTETLQSAGYQALWAGGCVRDQLLDKQPKDYDVATNATPDQIRDLFGRGRTLALGAAFGVITVIGPKSAGNIEVATFRRDADYSDGRRPDSIEYSTAEMDAERRDFTINGLFYDPLKDEIIDYVGGRNDLARRLIRAIGNPAERIAEDKLRMLRAVRFAANLNFELDPTTIETVTRHADEISVVSAERISAELTRMLTNENRRRAIELLVETRLFAAILPEAKQLTEDSDRFELMLGHLDTLHDPPIAVAFSVLLSSSVSAEQFGQLCKRLKQPNVVTDCGKWILQNAARLIKADALPWSEVQPLLIHPFAEPALQYIEAISADGSAIAFCRERLAWPAERLDPPALLDGAILRQRGFNPGPQYKEILNETRRAQLDGEISTTDQAIEIARSLV